MIQFRALSVAILVGGVMIPRPAAAQYGDVSRSQMHTVSVTIAPRVKVELSQVSLTPPHTVPTAVTMTRKQGVAEGLALSVHATQSWVLSMKSRTSRVARNSNLRWSASPRGEFTAITSADTVLVAGKPSASRADTAVFFRAAGYLGAQASPDEDAVVLTVTAP